MWSYHSQDPASEEGLATLQHERMGASSLNFLGGLDEERVEEGTQSFSLLNDNVSATMVTNSIVMCTFITIGTFSLQHQQLENNYVIAGTTT